MFPKRLAHFSVSCDARATAASLFLIVVSSIVLLGPILERKGRYIQTAFLNGRRLYFLRDLYVYIYMPMCETLSSPLQRSVD